MSSGDTLILQELPIENDVPNTSQENTSNNANNEASVENSYDCPGILMKHVVPADNSCLFTSVNFVLNGKVDETGK